MTLHVSLQNMNGLNTQHDQPEASQSTALANGVHHDGMSTVSTAKLVRAIEQLPPEILAELQNINTALVPMNRLISRVALQCGADLQKLLEELKAIQLTDPNLLPPKRLSNGLVDDSTDANREKKTKLFEFAEKHKKDLIKLLVLLQWSSKNEGNMITIAMNKHLQELRQAFTEMNHGLVYMLDAIVPLQDPCPDLISASEALSRGRSTRLPDLGYREDAPLTTREILRTFERMNSVLTIRLHLHEEIPDVFSKWHVHDGRVTFTVRDEFELDLSVLDESLDTTFRTVDFRFTFRPTPSVSARLHDRIIELLNLELQKEGLQGAYNFLHDLTLSQKLAEMHAQARTLESGLWARHLRVELMRRTLAVQYWTQKPTVKSWLEVSIDSGRACQVLTGSKAATPHLRLKWMRNAKEVLDHDIIIDTNNINFEGLLQQVIAQHTASTFDSIYHHLCTTTLYAGGVHQLSISVEASVTDAGASQILVEVSNSQPITIRIDSIDGTLLLSPMNQHTNRAQHDLARLKNPVVDFVSRFHTLRCVLAETNLSEPMLMAGFVTLPGMKLAMTEVKSLFGPQSLRATFYKQHGWTKNCFLAAVFAADGDSWWFVQGAVSSERTVRKLDHAPIHAARTFSSAYFETLTAQIKEMMTPKASQSALSEGVVVNLRSGGGCGGVDVYKIGDDAGFHTIKGHLTVRPVQSRTLKHMPCSAITVKVSAQPDLLSRIAATLSDPSIELNSVHQRLRLRFDRQDGDDIMSVAIPKMRYVDNVISCLQLATKVKQWHTESVTFNIISIAYSIGKDDAYSVHLKISDSGGPVEVYLLPKLTNPHQLILSQLREKLNARNGSLADRLRNAMSMLMISAPLLNSLAYLQGQVSKEVVPELQDLDLTESQAWLRLHVLHRSAMQFPVHYLALHQKLGFERDKANHEAPMSMLIRLEVEQLTPRDRHQKPCWIIRPALEENGGYARSAFTAGTLEHTLRTRVFSVSNDDWIGLDNAAQCRFDRPYRLIEAVHLSILEWQKESIGQASKVPKTPVTAAAPKQGAKNAPIKQTAPTTAMQQRPVQNPAPSRANPVLPNQVRASQTNGQVVRSGMMPQQGVGRPANGTADPSVRPNQGPATASVRVMTAAPQQVRFPPQNQPRRPGQGMPAMHNQLQIHPRSGHNPRTNPNEIITLD